jgi:Domain of unknown function (DUF4412)
MMHALAGLTVALLAATPVMAQEHPTLAPTRDVTIDYRLESKAAGNQPRTMKIQITAGGTRMRVEAQPAPGYMIMDRTAGRTIMVMTQQHTYADVPTSPAMANTFQLTDKMGFTRQGTDTVAGQRCTVWTVRRENGAGVACITDDGVLLRGDSDTGGGPSHIVATKVTYGTLADSVFQAPPDYKKMDVPAGAGRPGMAPGVPHP